MKDVLKKVISNVISKIVLFLIIVFVLLCGVNYLFNKNNRITKREYGVIINSFEENALLVVASADVTSTERKEFTYEMVKDWPSWTEPFTKAIASRSIELEIPIKTEFKIQLKDIDKNDIVINNNVLSFKKPLVINVDSQVYGEITILKSSNGLVDKTVDVFTSGRKAQEFLAQKSQMLVYDTSSFVINDSETKSKVIKCAKKELDNLINLGNSHKSISVKIDSSDVIFVNVDLSE